MVDYKSYKGGNRMFYVTVTDATFDATVLKSAVPVLVDFWAVWCGPCQMQGPIVEEVAHIMDGKEVIGKMNVDENPQTAQKYNIMSIPTIILFKNGQPVKQLVGVQSKDTIIGELNKLLV